MSGARVASTAGTPIRLQNPFARSISERFPRPAAEISGQAALQDSNEDKPSISSNELILGEECAR